MALPPTNGSPPPAGNIQRIGIKGLRRLRDLDLQLRPLMVTIGANGVGKSSLLDTFTLLAASASGRLDEVLSRYGGITSLLTRGLADELAFSVEMAVPHHEPLSYQLHLVPQATGYAIASESLAQSRRGCSRPFQHIDSTLHRIRYFEPTQGALLEPSWEHNLLETSLSQVPKMFREPEEMRKRLGAASHYHVLDVGPRAPIKLPQSMKPATLPGPDGEDLVPYLYYLRETRNPAFESIIDALHAAFPTFEELRMPPVATGMLTLTWKDRAFPQPLAMHELSEGTLRFLWLASLLQSPSLPTITMIDEPEVSLHPELLNLLAGLLREAARRTQLIVATHSDRLIRFLHPKEVVVMDINEDGATTATWADTLDLDHWLTDYSLDEVWSMGQMGGRA